MVVISHSLTSVLSRWNQEFINRWVNALFDWLCEASTRQKRFGAALIIQIINDTAVLKNLVNGYIICDL
jgi:hypothetical protein